MRETSKTTKDGKDTKWNLLDHQEHTLRQTLLHGLLRKGQEQLEILRVLGVPLRFWFSSRAT
jgi:hypothetical protein